MSDQGYGYQQPLDSASDFAKHDFHIVQVLSRTRTVIAVQVISCTNAGGVSPVGFVSVQPAVNMVDGLGNAFPHGIIGNVPYLRIQGGTNAIIVDPVAGELGLCAICDRDISSVKTNKAVSNPGSYRRFDLADAVYLGGMLNGTPTSYLQWLPDGTANIVSPAAVSITAPSVTLNGITIPQGGSGTGVSGTFTSEDGKTITVTNGIITGIS